MASNFLTGPSQADDADEDDDDDDDEDEVQIIDPNEPLPRPRHRYTTGWVLNDWETATPAPAPPATLAPASDPRQIAAELLQLTRKIDVNDLVHLVCPFCIEATPTLHITVKCGHLIGCSTCKASILSCPMCRGPVNGTVSVQTGSFMHGWKEPTPIAANSQPTVDPMAGRRPADVDWADRLAQESEELAREMQSKFAGDIFTEIPVHRNLGHLKS